MSYKYGGIYIHTQKHIYCNGWIGYFVGMKRERIRYDYGRDGSSPNER